VEEKGFSQWRRVLLLKEFLFESNAGKYPEVWEIMRGVDIGCEDRIEGNSQSGQIRGRTACPLFVMNRPGPETPACPPAVHRVDHLPREAEQLD